MSYHLDPDLQRRLRELFPESQGNPFTVPHDCPPASGFSC